MSAELEAAILGAVFDADGPAIRSNAGALVDMAGLRQQDFLDPRIQICWPIVLRLAARSRPVDANTVFAGAQAAKKLQGSDLAWLQSLQSRNSMDGARFAQVAEQLRRISRARVLQGQLEEAQRQLKGGGDVFKIASSLEGICRDTAIDHASDDTADQDVLEIAAEWELRDQGKGRPLLVPTGIKLLDEYFRGFWPNLNVIMGLPSAGKTALVDSIIEQQLLMGLRVGIFGLEDGTRHLGERLIAKRLGIPVGDVGSAKLTGMLAERYGDVMQEVTTLLKAVVTYRHDTITAWEMCRRGTHWVRNLGVQCIYLDHGGEVEHDTAKFQDYRLAVGDSYRQMRNLARREQVPVVAVAHTTRASDEDEDRPPRAKDASESAYIERRARTMLGCWVKRGRPDEMRVTGVKNTKGRTGWTLALKRLTTAALIDQDGGEEVSLEQERRLEAKSKRLERVKETDEVKAERAAMAAARKPAKKPSPQAALGLAVVDDEKERA
jgi:replicative DNA helicase